MVGFGDLIPGQVSYPLYLEPPNCLVEKNDKDRYISRVLEVSEPVYVVSETFLSSDQRLSYNLANFTSRYLCPSQFEVYTAEYALKSSRYKIENGIANEVGRYAYRKE